MARLRLNINLVTGKIDSSPATRRLDGRNFATTIARDVGFEYAEKEWKRISSTVRSDIGQAVTSEIRNIARQYERAVVGRGQRSTQFNLTSYAKSETATAAGNLLPTTSVGLTRPWPKLTPKYVRWKESHGYSPGHFLLHGYLGQSLSKGDSWTELFGPVSVRIIRRLPQGPEDHQLPTIRAGGVGDITFHIAKIEVRAFGEITARMLPALIDGKIGFGTDGRTNGLLGLVGSRDEELAWHLGQNPKTAPYRSTLEPFLGFVLTRAIPSAVKQRVAKLASPGA